MAGATTQGRLEDVSKVCEQLQWCQQGVPDKTLQALQAVRAMYRRIKESENDTKHDR